MATREFNGTTDFLHCGGDGTALADIANAYSIVAIVKPLAEGTGGTYVSCSRTTTVSPLAEMFDPGPSPNQLGHYNYLDGLVATTLAITATDWQVLGIDKAAGDNIFPRGHRCLLGSAGTHGDCTVSVGSEPTDAWTITEFGRRGTGTNYKNYRIAVAAVFDYQLTDANYNTISASHSTAAIAALGPVALWEFNQAAVTTAVVDLVGSAHQITRTGTTAVADDPVWTYGIPTSGFPTNSTILDTFTGTEDPITTNWGDTLLIGGDTGRLAKIGGFLTNATGGGVDTSGWYDAATFGPDVEVFITIPTVSGVAGNQIKLLARIQSPGASFMSGYELHVQKDVGTDIWRLRRRDNVTPTVLGADMNQEIASGDSIGLSVIGNTLSAYYKSGAGAWTLIGTRTDATYSAAGFIGFKTFQASPGAWQADNFGGGTAGGVVLTAPTVPQAFQATTGLDSQVPLSWSAPASDGGSPITNYKIYRGLSPGTESLYASPTGVTVYTDNAVVNDTTYYYEVSAINAIGESPLSNEISATPAAPVVATASRAYKRMYGPTLLGSAAALLYTCPPQTTAVVRHVHVSNPTGVDVNFTLSIGQNTASTRIWDAQPILANDVLDHYQDFTLLAGEVIQGLGSSASALNLTIDGYEVSVGGTPPAAPIYPADTLFPSDTSP